LPRLTERRAASRCNDGITRRRIDMTKLWLFAAVVCALVVAAPAAAKEPQTARLCGDEGCTTTTDRGQLFALMQDAGPGSPPPAAKQHRSYSVDVSVIAEPQLVHIRYRYFPDARMKRFADGTWAWVQDASLPVYGALAAQADSGDGGSWFPWRWAIGGAALLALATVTAVALLRRRGRVFAPHPEGA
jgi:hypothetical protein